MLEFNTRFCLHPTSCSPAIRNTICSDRLVILIRETCPASVARSITKLSHPNKTFEPARSSWSSWLKPLGLALGGAAVVLGMFTNPLTPVAIGVAALTIAKDTGIGGLELYQDWKNGKTHNGLHYLLRFKQV